MIQYSLLYFNWYNYKHNKVTSKNDFYFKKNYLQADALLFRFTMDDWYYYVEGDGGFSHCLGRALLS